MRKTNKTAIIIGAAPCESLDCLAPYRSDSDFILCADGGRRTAERCGLVPDAYVGDGDSGGDASGLNAVQLPAEKDFTDLEAAIHRAVELGFGRLILCACTGGRADHSLANFCLLERAWELGAEALLVDDWNEARFVTAGRYIVDNEPPYRYLGLLPLDRTLEDVSLSGVKYAVTHQTFRRSATLGVSNEILPGQRAELRIGAGRGLLIRSEPL